MLKMAKIELELVPDPDKYIFFEKGKRSGVSYISNRYSKANNKSLKSYDSKQWSKHIINLDTNNLYGYGMSKFFPIYEFKWIDPKEFDLNKYTRIVLKAVFSKLILNIQKKLWELHNDYLLVPDKIEIKREMLSKYQLKIDDLYNIPFGNLLWKLTTLLKTGIKTKITTSRIRIQSAIMIKTIYIIQHTKKYRTRKKRRQRWTSILQINVQCYLWKSDGKLGKQNRCETSKQRKRLFKINIQTKLYVAQNIWQ